MAFVCACEVRYGRGYAEAGCVQWQWQWRQQYSHMRTTKGARGTERLGCCAGTKGLLQVPGYDDEVVCEGESGLDGWKGLMGTVQ